MQFLFIYRSTPHSVTEVASSELFLGRKLKTKLDLMRPDVRRRVEEKQARQKKGHDLKSKERVFRVGEAVWFKDHRRGHLSWAKGTIKKVLGAQMYLIAQKDGKIRKRHGDQLQTRLTGRDEKDRKLNVNHDWMDVTEEIASDEEELLQLRRLLRHYRLMQLNNPMWRQRQPQLGVSH